MQAAIAGFALGLSLILAIGAQNAFVLRQGILRRHVVPVVLVCALSDAILIAAGVAGFGAVSARVPALEPLMRLAGAAFLVWYALRTMRAALAGGQALEAATGAQTRRGAVLTALALTWLNPHVYLDTVVLLGAVSAQYDDASGFGLGAVSASFVFFTVLGFGARALAPLLARPGAWRVLDGLVALTMMAIAAKLLLGLAA